MTLPAQNLTSGANSSDPAQDSQASDQKGRSVGGLFTSIRALLLDGLAFDNHAMALRSKHEALMCR
jgi:hypothetical protein